LIWAESTFHSSKFTGFSYVVLRDPIGQSLAGREADLVDQQHEGDRNAERLGNRSRHLVEPPVAGGGKAEVAPRRNSILLCVPNDRGCSLGDVWREAQASIHASLERGGPHLLREIFGVSRCARLRFIGTQTARFATRRDGVAVDSSDRRAAECERSGAFRR
jgi:hypothetical protein